MSAEHESLLDAQERAVALWLELARSHPDATAEFEASVPEFFGGALPLDDPAAALLAARRHAEWFLFERHSAALKGAPAERLLGDLRDRIVGDEDEEALDTAAEHALRSHTGAFLVEEVRPGEGAWLRDLSGLAQYPLLAPELTARLASGDLLVGRLYPVGDGLHAASPAAGIFRGPDLVVALERDLDTMRRGPGAKVLRLSQLELERMFFRAAQGATAPVEVVPDAVDIEATVERARAHLLAAGLGAGDVAAILARLGAEPLVPENLTPGAGDALGVVLDELAFSTELDLSETRQVLLEAWRALPELARRAVAARALEEQLENEGSEERAERERVAARQLSDAERATVIEEFAARRAAGGDALAEIAALQAALGLEGDESDEPESPAPDFPGVVGAMVHEFVWETSVTEGEAAARELAPLAHLVSFAEPIGVFEELGGKDLVRFASFWVIERDLVQEPDGARALLRALRRFAEWCREAHEHDVMGALEPALDGLERSLPRVVAANRLVHDPLATEDDPGAVYEVADEAAATLRDSEGNAHPYTVPAPLREHLALGDRVRGHVEAGVLRAARVYPPEASLAR